MPMPRLLNNRAVRSFGSAVRDRREAGRDAQACPPPATRKNRTYRGRLPVLFTALAALALAGALWLALPLSTDSAQSAAALAGTETPPASVSGAALLPPRSVTVAPGASRELEVSWEAPDGEDALPVTGYKVQWKSGTEDYDGTSTSTRQAVLASSDQLTYTITGMSNGTEYAVRVIAYNGQGEGPASAEVTATPEAPNVIVILVDDLGYVDVSFNAERFGIGSIETPNLDGLASAGVVFTNGYVTFPICTPSRSGLLTGRYPSRFGVEGNIYYNPFDKHLGLPVEETTFPTYLQEAGYRTGAVGKWQLGGANLFTPLKRGFDYFYGFLGGLHDYWRVDASRPANVNVMPLMENKAPATFTGYLTDALTDKAIFVPSRFGVEGNIYYNPFDKHLGLPVEETTFPTYLQEAGYRTGAVGKWQLGGANLFTPLKRGFDYFYGFLGGLHDYWRVDASRPANVNVMPLMENKAPATFTGYLTDALTDKAIEFVQGGEEEPFFLYLAYNAPHDPLQAPKELIEKYADEPSEDRRIYLAMVDSLDQNVGRLLEALKESGERDNTIVFFLSDNGGTTWANNYPFYGGKGSFQEGGIRVPFIASWPARWPEGQEYEPAVISLDIAATVLGAAKATVTDEARPIEGVDLDPYLRGEEEGPPHEALYWRDSREDQLAVVRSGDWKLIHVNGEKPELYDVGIDPDETEDMFKTNRRVAAELAALWNEWNGDNFAGSLFHSLESYERRLQKFAEQFARERRTSAESLSTRQIEIGLLSNFSATGAPTISGTAQVGETLAADTSGIADADGLDNATFAYQWLRRNGTTDTDIAGATGSSYTLADADEGRTVRVRVSFTDDAGNQETLTSAPTTAVAAGPNTPATGAPTISGTSKVGETLTADTSGIADADGLDNAVFAYQWLADDKDIAGAAGSSYTLTGVDEGKAIKVKVSFTDDEGNEETLTSAPVGPDRPYGLTAAVSGGAVVLTWKPPVGQSYMFDYQILRNRPELGEAEPLVYVEYTNTDETTYTDTDVEPGVLYVYRVKAVADVFGRLGEASEPVEIRTAEPTPGENSPATGAPTISGAAQVGETLTADTSGIADADGLDNVSFTYQWVADDADIAGATGSSYTLTGSDEGRAIKVRVSFSDDEGNEETLTSAATRAVAAEPAPLTAQFLDTPPSHDGQTAFTFELRLSEEFELSYVTLRDHAFTVTGGAVAGARRLDPTGNTRWEITVRPDGDGEVTVVLPATEDCEDQGAICTGDGRPLSNRTELTVQVPTPANSAATGAPTISGTAQVGETLTSDTSGIADDEGLDNATYTYQWIANDGISETDIQDATGSTYTLVSGDEGKTIKVRVSFTDDGGNAETLTSDATPGVVGAASQWIPTSSMPRLARMKLSCTVPPPP